MSDINQVFKRIEKKYKIDEKTRCAIENDISSHLHIDQYGRTRITSIYLDTPNLDLICRSLEKPLYKEKLRIRTYGDKEGKALVETFSNGIEELSSLQIKSLNAIPVFFELKKKFKGIVYKRRIVLSLSAAYYFYKEKDYVKACMKYPLEKENYLNQYNTPEKLQIANELTAALERYENLSPAMAISCKRTAWGQNSINENEYTNMLEEIENQLRITFDDSLMYLDMRQKENNKFIPIISPEESIMEIKSAKTYPLWIVNVLTSNNVFPTSFSKYGTASQKVYQNKIYQNKINERYFSRCIA